MKALYIYFQVQPSQAALLQPALVGMQTQLRSAMPGLAANLHQRTQSHAVECAPSISHPNTTTWMETYHFNGHADHRAWQHLLLMLSQAVSQLPPGIDGERHVEWFARTT